MSQKEIPCILMRGGSSKGPYINLADLPVNREERDRLLLGIMGSPDKRQIDGIGGAEFLTSKVAMVGTSSRPGIDVDYLFAQVAIDTPIVDTEPPCGNMLAGVGPYAIEAGLVEAADPVTHVMIFNVNTNAVIEAIVQTPEGQVSYEGDVKIDGVPGSAAPVVLNFSNVVGGKTGSLLPTGNACDTIEGVEVSCVDASMPMVLMQATSLGLIGDEDADFFKTNKDVMTRIESIRLIAGERMGLGDVRDTVVPKVGLLSQAVAGGTIRSRYLTPHSLHAAHAVTGGICVATAACMPGSVANSIADVTSEDKQLVVIEHIAGKLEIMLEIGTEGASWTIKSAGAVRTARKIMNGVVYANL
ncbi:MAG: 4-oxalomesaconate tautomerase [Gammaproteobacteria bacterium]|nr:4-oxalomesaconate tautomerase [Gammaproteobacteria bacterium]